MYLHVRFISFEITPVTTLVSDLVHSRQMLVNVSNFFLLSSQRVDRVYCFVSVVKARNLLNNVLYHFFCKKSCTFLLQTLTNFKFTKGKSGNGIWVFTRHLIGFFISPLGADVRRAWEASQRSSLLCGNHLFLIHFQLLIKSEIGTFIVCIPGQLHRTFAYF